MNPFCTKCGKAHIPGYPQWKCCSKHTTGFGSDWVCDDCAVKLHPDKASIVTHALPGANGMLPCCDLHQLEVEQNDRVSVIGQVVTCTGHKRYRKDRNGQG